MTEILVKPVELKSTASELRKNASDFQERIRAIDAILQSLTERLSVLNSQNDPSNIRYQHIRKQIDNIQPLIRKFATELEEAANRFSAADRV